MVKPHGTFRLIWVRALQGREQEVDLIPVLKQPHRSTRLCLAAEDDEIGLDGANIRHVEGDFAAKVHEANPYILRGIELGFKETYLRFQPAAECASRASAAARARSSHSFAISWWKSARGSRNTKSWMRGA